MKSPTFKDLDYLDLLPEGLLLEPDTYSALCTTMTRDCRVMESFKIMDYSLLVGVHNIDQASKEREEALADESSLPESDQEPKSRTMNEKSRERLVAHSTAMESIQATSDPVDLVHDTPPGGIPARNHKGERLFLFVGIIDILQSYRLIKKFEHTFKAMIHDGDTVSVHRPGFYAERFLKFMTGTTFKKIPSSLKHSPSKRTKSVKSKPTSQPPGQAGGSGSSGQDCSAPPSKEGMASVPPDVVPDSGPRDLWAASGEVISVSDVRLEQRLTASSTSSLGTPSYTESTCSGDQALPSTPSHSRDLDYSESVP